MLAYIPYMDPMGTIPESQSCSTRFQPIPTPSFPWLSQSPKISQKIVDHTRSLKLISIAIVQYTYHLHIFYTYSIHILYIFYTYSIHIILYIFYTYLYISIHILYIFYTYTYYRNLEPGFLNNKPKPKVWWILPDLFIGRQLRQRFL